MKEAEAVKKPPPSPIMRKGELTIKGMEKVKIGLKKAPLGSYLEEPKSRQFQDIFPETLSGVFRPKYLIQKAGIAHAGGMLMTMLTF